MKRAPVSYLASLLGIRGMFRGLYDVERKPFKWTVKPRVKSERNPKDTVKKAAQIRRAKTRKLNSLSKSKRRTVYYYNLRHSVKMYGKGA